MHSPSLDIHGLGERGYTWLRETFEFPIVHKFKYPNTGMKALINFFEGNVLPKLTCPRATKCPTPPFHSIASSKRLFMLNIFGKRRMVEKDSPFFGIFEDEEKTVLLDIADPDPPPPPIQEEEGVVPRILPFRGEGWQLKGSIWAERVKLCDSRDFWDTDRTYQQCFMRDWIHLVELPRVRNLMQRLDETVKDGRKTFDEEMQQVHDVLYNNYRILLNIFRVYSCVEGASHNAFTMDMFGYRKFCQDAGLVAAAVEENPDPGVRKLGMNICQYDQLFILVNFEDDKNSKESKANDDRALMRLEWLEMILRLAILEFGHVLKYDFSDCVQSFVDKIVPRIPNYYNAIDFNSNDFRSSRMYNHKVDEILKSNVQVLRAIFTRFKCSTDKKRSTSENAMDMKDWNSFILTLGLLELGIIPREANMVFIRSTSLCVKELYEPKRAFRLQFVSFLEALCRLADIMDIPDKQVQIILGFCAIMKGWWGWYRV
jgi:hypothetical protein